jgi:hypothetical protein
MSVAARTDTDGAVDMAVAQPIYEFMKAPRLKQWSQPVLAQFVGDRRQYEEKIRERCGVTGEVRKVDGMMSDHVPDVTHLFATSLRMDMREPDTEARISKYYIDFDKLVEDNGLTGMVENASKRAGSEPVYLMKLRCKLLIKNLLPEMLRTDVERLAELTHVHVKRDDTALYDLVVERATRQQHFHLMQIERKHTKQQ